MRGLEVLYEDNHLLVVNKPPGMATMGSPGKTTVHSWAADYLRRKYEKPGRVFVGIVSRLDAVTSGALVLARTSKAASRLVPQFGGAGPGNSQKWGRATKLYLAVIEGQPTPANGHWSDSIVKDEAARRMRVVETGREGSQRASLRYWTLVSDRQTSIIAIQLQTGRKHQIRVQLGDRGHAVWADRKYGSRRSMPSKSSLAGVALHSWRLQITHPTRREPVWFEAGVPESWGRFRSSIPNLESVWQQISGDVITKANPSE